MGEKSVSFEIYDVGQVRAVARVNTLIENGAVHGVEGLVSELARAEGTAQVRKTFFLWQNGHHVDNEQPQIDRPIGLYDCTGAVYSTIQVPDSISLRIEK